MKKKAFPHFHLESSKILNQVPKDEPLPEPDSDEDLDPNHDLRLAIEFLLRKKNTDDH